MFDDTFILIMAISPLLLSFIIDLNPECFFFFNLSPFFEVDCNCCVCCVTSCCLIFMVHCSVDWFCLNLMFVFTEKLSQSDLHLNQMMENALDSLKRKSSTAALKLGVGG